MAKKVYLIDTENVGSVWVEVLPSLSKQDSLYLFYTIHSSGIAYSDLVKIMNQAQKFELVECYTGRNGLDFQLVSYLGYMMKSSPKSEYIIISNDNGYDAVVRFWNARGGNVSRVKASVIRQRIAQDMSFEQGETEQEVPVQPEVQEEQPEVDVMAEPEEVKEEDNLEKEVAADVVETEMVEETTELPKKRTRRKPVRRKKVEKEKKIDFSIWLPEEESVPEETLLTIFQIAGRKEMHKIYVQMVKNFGQVHGGVIYHALKPHIEEIYDILE